MNWNKTWNWFDKNPGNINLKGRPKKWISAVNDELKKKWFEPATKQDIIETYLSLLQLDRNHLVELSNDESKPMLVRILVKNMLGWKGFDIIERMLDRWIGKATQINEHTGANGWPIEQIAIFNLPNNERNE